MELLKLSLIRYQMEENRSFHDYVLYYVIDGNAAVFSENRRSVLEKEDVIVFNPEEEHGIDCSKAIAVRIAINSLQLSRQIGYMPWSAIDLIGLSTGTIDKRYGFIYVDTDNKGEGTFRRLKKDSFYWYKKVIASDGEDLD